MNDSFQVQGVANSLWGGETAALAVEERQPRVLLSGAAEIALAMCLPAYVLGVSLVQMGLSREQALLALAVGSALVCAGMVLQARVGDKYCIPYAVAARASFGVLGARVPVILRAMVGCGWFGIQCWLGALLLFAIGRLRFAVLPPGTIGVCFAVCLAASVLVACGKGSGRWQLPVIALLLAGVALLAGTSSASGSALIPGAVDGALPALPLLVLSGVTAVTGFWAFAAVGSADLARHGRSEKQSQTALIVGMLAGMTLFAAMGVMHPLLIWSSAAGTTPFAVEGVCLATLATAALLGSARGLRSLAREIANLQPEAISFRLGTIVAALVGTAWMPWRLLADPRHYLRGWLPGCAGVLWPICGIMLVDFFVVRRRWLNLEALYTRDGVYEYTDGVNGKALVAFAAGVVAALGGRLVFSLHELVTAAGFLGFAVAGLVYLVLMSGPPAVAAIPPTPLLIPVAEFDGEGA